MNLKLDAVRDSLTPFEWSNVPSFAVLTGPNGCGKTQLLSAIFDSVRRHARAGGKLTIEGADPTLKSGVFVDSKFEPLNVEQQDFESSRIQNTNRSKWEEFRNKLPGYDMKHRGRPGSEYRIIEFAVERTGKPPYEITQDDFIDRVMPYWVEDQADIFAKRVARRCVNYDLACYSRFKKGMSHEQVLAELGTPPWARLNALFADVGLPFQLEDPITLGNQLPFTFSVVNSASKARVRLSELSLGERSLMTLCCLLFNSEDETRFPDILLLDEPDAHLHPAVMKHLIYALNDVIVGQYGVRVLMTTHRPTTVQFVPDASLFEMRRGEYLAILPAMKRSSIGMLTAGFVNVLPATRHVLVEDEADVKFYSAAFELALHDRAVPGDVPLQFMSAGKQRAGDSTSGGRGEVAKLVGRVLGTPLDSLILGLIDRDDDAYKVDNDGVLKLDRYSIENYLVDPLVVYYCLANQQAIPADIDTLPTSRISVAEAGQLAEIANALIGTCERGIGALNADERRLCVVAYANGLEMRYPEWLFQRRGKDLLNGVVGKAFGNHVVN